MRYWLFMFRPDTYQQVKKHLTIGVNERQKKRFSQLAKGDKFVVYVSRTKFLDGYGEITNKPFEDNTLIFSENQVYPYRCSIKLPALDKAKPAGDTLWGLSPFQGDMNTTPTNLIFCKGGFIEITEKDYNWLVALIDGNPEHSPE